MYKFCTHKIWKRKSTQILFYVLLIGFVSACDHSNHEKSLSADIEQDSMDSEGSNITVIENTMDMMDDYGVDELDMSISDGEINTCLTECLQFLTCSDRGVIECGYKTRAAFASTCQIQCMENPSQINAIAMMGCDHKTELLDALALSCTSDLLCHGVDCMGGLCDAGQCVPFSCTPDLYDVDDNHSQSKASLLPFVPFISNNLTLCNDEHDWYVVEIPANAALRIDIAFQHMLADIDLKVYNAVGNQIYTSASDSNNEIINILPTYDEQVIWFEVFMYRSHNNGEMMRNLNASYQIYLSTDLPIDTCNEPEQCDDQQF